MPNALLLSSSSLYSYTPLPNRKIVDGWGKKTGSEPNVQKLRSLSEPDAFRRHGTHSGGHRWGVWGRVRGKSKETPWTLKRITPQSIRKGIPSDFDRPRLSGWWSNASGGVYGRPKMIRTVEVNITDVVVRKNVHSLDVWTRSPLETVLLRPDCLGLSHLLLVPGRRAGALKPEQTRQRAACASLVSTLDPAFL